MDEDEESYVHPCVYASASSASEEEGQPPHHKGCSDILCILSNYTVYGCSCGWCLNTMTCNALGSKNYKDNITSTLSREMVKQVSDTSNRIQKQMTILISFVRQVMK